MELIQAQGSVCWADETDATSAVAFAAWCAAALARDLAVAAGPWWQGRLAAPEAGDPS